MKKLLIACLMVNLFLGSSLMNNTHAQNKPTLNHIAIYVVNLKASTDFYQHIIGLDTIPEPFHDGKHAWLGIGFKSALHVIEGAASVTVHDKTSHLCFSISSITDFTNLLKANHIEYENWPGDKNVITKRVDGVHQIYFRDPDGYWIEINDAKE